VRGNGFKAKKNTKCLRAENTYIYGNYPRRQNKRQKQAKHKLVAIQRLLSTQQVFQKQQMDKSAAVNITLVSMTGHEYSAPYSELYTSRYIRDIVDQDPSTLVTDN